MKIVEFETAVKLKEAGFDLPVLRWYFIKGSTSTNISMKHPLTGLNWNKEIFTKRISAPYQYEVVDWLREVHGIEIRINPLYTKSGEKEGYNYTTFNSAESMIEKELDLISSDGWCIKNYPEVLKQGILEAIKNI